MVTGEFAHVVFVFVLDRWLLQSECPVCEREPSGAHPS